MNVFDTAGVLGDFKCRIANNHIRGEEGMIANFDEKAEYCPDTAIGSIAVYFKKMLINLSQRFLNFLK